MNFLCLPATAEGARFLKQASCVRLKGRKRKRSKRAPPLTPFSRVQFLSSSKPSLSPLTCSPQTSILCSNTYRVVTCWPPSSSLELASTQITKLRALCLTSESVDRTQFFLGQTLKAIDFLVARLPWSLQELEDGQLCLADLHGNERAGINWTSFSTSIDAIVAINLNLEVILLSILQKKIYYKRF